MRTSYFPDLRTRALFVHGTSDPFGSIEELRGYHNSDSRAIRTYCVVDERRTDDLKRSGGLGGAKILAQFEIYRG